MAADLYYLLTSLPPLGDLGSPAPMTPAGLLEHVADAPSPRERIGALFLGDDLLLREAVLAGEVEQASPAVLSPAQLRDEAPLPAFLTRPDSPASPRAAVDAIWEAYFRHVAAVAARQGSAFLAAWVEYEVSLRNALAAERAKALALEGEPYLVAADLAASRDDLAPVVSEWAAAANPLAALRALDAARWAWLVAHDGWFTFADDELVAYAAKLMLLHRWNRMEAARPDARIAGAGPARPTPT